MLNYLDSENIMSTITILREGKSLIQRTVNSIATFKDRYCPDGRTCEDLATLGSLAFIGWFMYIALKPLSGL